MKHLFKSTRGASATEYAMLLSLIGGLAIVAAASFATDTRRAFDLSATALASTVPGLSSAPATGGAEAVFPDDPAPGEETPPAVDPVLSGHSYRFTGVWLPLTAPGLENPGLPTYIEYAPASLSLFAPVNEARPSHPQYPVIVPGDRLAGFTLTSAGWWSIDYRDSAGATMMDALLFAVEERPGFVFVVPAPWSPQEEADVQSGAVWRVNRMAGFSPEPGASLELPLQFEGEPVYE